MRALALLTDDGTSVANVIVAEAWPGAIDVTDITPRPGPGWAYDGVVFTPPAPTPDPPADASIPRDDFIERFTPQEWLDGQQRALTDANLAFALALLMGKPDGRVNLASPRVSQALGYMVAIGMLTPERAAAIGGLPQ
jgi:hypothetical protein